MRITYDSEVDALYIRFIETTVTTEHVAEGIAVDYDTDGRIAGIEILDDTVNYILQPMWKTACRKRRNSRGRFENLTAGQF